MAHRLSKSAAAFAVAALVFSSAAVAQAPEKAAAKTLAATTSSDAAKAAMAAALPEVYNIGGGPRVDPKLKAIVDADPKFALGRAYYAGWTSTFTAADRAREFNQALSDAALKGAGDALRIAPSRGVLDDLDQPVREGSRPPFADLRDVAQLEVYVRVDETRQDDCVAKIELIRAAVCV